MNVEIGRQKIIILLGSNEATQFHFWEYINRNQTFISGILTSPSIAVCSEHHGPTMLISHVIKTHAVAVCLTIIKGTF
jgi:hypothetical protein